MSTYMEGSHCVIAKLGYSRDHLPDVQQIVLALMVTSQGSPFYWKVLEGKTQDITTLPGVVKDLKQHFGLKSCHLVLTTGWCRRIIRIFSKQKILPYGNDTQKHTTKTLAGCFSCEQ